MGDIDWQKLYHATNTENKPTPGYLFNDIVRNVSYAAPKLVPGVAQYLVDCVDGDHAHVKLKALFVIKNVAYRVPPFSQCMQQHLGSVKAAASFTGPPSALYGDEPYRLVREAAEGALDVLTGGEHYHAQYPEMSQRIVGFGNYLPSEDTLLPDGDVDTGVSYRDAAASAVGAVQSGVGALLGGVKDILVSPFQRRSAEGISLDLDELGGDLEGPGGPGVDDLALGGEEPDIDDDDGSLAPTGTYVPPALLVPTPAATQDARGLSKCGIEDWDTIMDWDDGRGMNTDEVTPIEDILRCADSGGAYAQPAHASCTAAKPGDPGKETVRLSDAEILDILGLDSEDPAPDGGRIVADPEDPSGVGPHVGADGVETQGDFSATVDLPGGFPSTFRHLLADREDGGVNLLKDASSPPSIEADTSGCMSAAHGMLEV